jgi:iron(III) transport system ATP-binding protein
MGDPMTAAIALDAVSAELARVRILDGISLEVGAGEILGVLGPSGSGKTTLLRLILGLTPPSAGEIRLAGRIASAASRIVIPPERRELAVVFQDLALWPHLSVAGNLEFALAAKGIGRVERVERGAAMLERVGLAGFGRRRPGELSGGERQRVAIARALVVEPRAVLLDEPLASLDPVLRAELLGELRALLREQQASAIYVTHDVREVARLADRLAVLEEGRISQEGSIDALRGAPATAFVRAIFDPRHEALSERKEGP